MNATKLYDKGIIARAEYEKYTFDYTYAKQALSGLEKTSSLLKKQKEIEEQIKI
jgi:HlyD family secretion protein